MSFDQTVSDVIKIRYSSRRYLDRPIASDVRRQLADTLAALECGPLGTRARFMLVAASEQERDALKRLGTYGFIKNPTGFILGTVEEGAKALEDFGYLMERAVLQATGLGLGTCWLGGSFTRSSFANKAGLQAGELLPAVVAAGYSDSTEGPRNAFRHRIGADTRLPWTDLFFDRRFSIPLTPESAGLYSGLLEAVRLGPSASNKQPWRVVRDGDTWHFYLQRTPGYRSSLGARLLGVADLQRVDMGIAMCHFELVAAERGLIGRWATVEPDIEKPDGLTEYTISWVV